MSANFLTNVLGAGGRFKMEAAWGADLSDVTGAGWTWVEVPVLHSPGTSATVGRNDNVSQAGAARLGFAGDNASGDLTVGNPLGAISLAQNTPVRYLLSLDALATFSIRYQGYLDSLNPTTDQSAKVRAAQATVLGALARIAGLKKPLRSALTRAITLSQPVAHWPMEDPAGSTSVASAVAGVGPLTKTQGTPVFGAVGPPGSSGAVDFQTGSPNCGVASPVLPTFTATTWRLEFSMLAPVDFGGLQFAIQCTGPDVRQILFNGFAGGNMFLNTTLFNNTIIGHDCGVTADDGLWHRMRLDVSSAGADIHYVVTMDGAVILSATDVGVAYSKPRSINFGSVSVSSLTPGERIAVTEVALWAPYASPITVDTMAAAAGHTGETVAVRLTRLCGELGIALAVTGTSDVTMGPQGVDTVLNLLRECEAADHGFLFDGFGTGISYQCRSARYAATAALTLDMGATPPQVSLLSPIFDKQAVKNLYAVSRKGGGTATVEQVTGPLGTARIGVEDAAATVNLDTDDPLAAHAAWLVTLGTVEGFRYPALQLDMLGAPTVAAAVLALKPGDRVTVLRPAAKATDLPPDPIDLIVEGWTETTTADTWQLTLNCSPYAPNAVAVVGDTVGRIDSADSTVGGAGLTTTATALTVASTLPWTTAAGDMPFDINVTGERMTVTNVAGAVLTVTRSVNGVVKTHAVGEPVRVWTDLTIGL